MSFGRPLRFDDVAELRWYFRQQDQIDHGGAPRGLPAVSPRLSRFQGAAV